MIWLRLVISIIFFLMLVYYALVVLQSFGVLEFTSETITFKKGIIPFYYWLKKEHTDKPLTTFKDGEI